MITIAEKKAESVLRERFSDKDASITWQYVKDIDVSWWKGELMWLAAVIDCEGSIGLQSQCSVARKDGSRTNQHAAIVQLSNTSKELTDLVVAILNRLGVIHVRTYYRDERYLINGWKGEHYVRISAHASVKKLLEAIEPYLVVKKRQAVAVIEFCNSRLGLPNYAKGVPYSEEELALVAQVKLLNKKGTG